MTIVKRWMMKVAYSIPDKRPHTRAVVHTKGEWVKWDDVQKLITAADEMDSVIASYDPQRAERHNIMRLTDAEYIAVNKWRIAKNPDYYK